jgi:acetolactate synthase I/III small subunit
MEKLETILINITVNNHPGVMSHITGLFSRRGYNLEGILCGKIGDTGQSRMYLLVEKNDLLEQIVRQLQKLYDVIDLSLEESGNSPWLKFMEQH